MCVRARKGGGGGSVTIIRIEDAQAQGPAVHCAKEEQRICACLMEVWPIWFLHQRGCRDSRTSFGRHITATEHPMNQRRRHWKCSSEPRANAVGSHQNHKPIDQGISACHLRKFEGEVLNAHTPQGTLPRMELCCPHAPLHGGPVCLRY